MGSKGRREDEEPQRSIFVSAFEMARVPVTNREYAVFLEATDAAPPPWWDDPLFNRARQPVVGVNWHEARAYCRWISGESGLEIRLPTEAEREKAARGGVEGLVFPWGNDRAGGGHSRLRGPLEGPEDVASTPPNGYGLFNTADTVHEWCLDGYRPNYYRDMPSSDPRAPAGVPRRSARGGSWRHQWVVTIYLSAASSWEIAIKTSLAKLSLPEPPSKYVPKRLTDQGIKALPIEHAHALHVNSLPAHHKDSFDRMLVAQAQIEKMCILTADEQITRYDVETIWAGQGTPP